MCIIEKRIPTAKNNIKEQTKQKNGTKHLMQNSFRITYTNKFFKNFNFILFYFNFNYPSFFNYLQQFFITIN
jgi:hypothetical protein